MTKREREQVVELLRCAADEVKTGTFIPITSAARSLGVRPYRKLWHEAVHARTYVHIVSSEPGGWFSDERWCLLEAARRVEEGSLP